MSNEKARERMAGESEHKSAYCAKHLILPSFVPSFDEEMCIQCRAELRTLKSLGLYWHTWPEQTPNEGEEVILRGYMSTYYYCSNDYDDEIRINRPAWSGENGIPFACEPGDRWLPLKALEVLP